MTNTERNESIKAREKAVQDAKDRLENAVRAVATAAQLLQQIEGVRVKEGVLVHLEDWKELQERLGEWREATQHFLAALPQDRHRSGAAMNRIETGHGYRAVRDFAGVRNGRSSSPMATFAEANRAAMKAAVERGQEVRVFAPDGQFIVSYTRGPEGRALLVAVGEQS